MDFWDEQWCHKFLRQTLLEMVSRGSLLAMVDVGFGDEASTKRNSEHTCSETRVIHILSLFSVQNPSCSTSLLRCSRVVGKPARTTTCAMLLFTGIILANPPRSLKMWWLWVCVEKAGADGIVKQQQINCHLSLSPSMTRRCEVSTNILEISFQALSLG
jgi:hypothetical protein